MVSNRGVQVVHFDVNLGSTFGGVMKISVYGFLLALVSLSATAGEDIGFGIIKGIKIGDSNVDQISVYLKDGYTHNKRNCNGVVHFRASDMSIVRYNQITSVLLSANLANKKVRLHSHFPNGCNGTFVAIQESVF